MAGPAILCFDLETIAGDHGRAALVALAAARAERRGASVEQILEVDENAFGALCPPLCQVVAVGVYVLATSRADEDVDAVFYDSLKLPARPDTPGDPHPGERILLRRVAEVIFRSSRLVTFNGRHFDVPVLLHRMLAHKIEPPPTLVRAAFEYRYRPDAHVDVLDLMTGFGAAERHSLAAYAIGHGLRDAGEKRTDGAEVEELVREGQTTRVVQHALDDVRETAALYRRFAPLLDLVREGVEVP